MLRLAIYGIGLWGDRLVGSVQGKSERVRFVAGCSRSPDQHAAFGQRYGMPVIPYAQALSSPEVDGVVLATPHSLHAGQVEAAAAAGKHVFVEKPFTLSVAEAIKAIAACRSAGIVLAHGYNRRFASAYRAMRDLIAEGRIGTLLHLEGQHTGPTGFALSPQSWRADPAECPAGALTARGVHPLDLMIDLAGPVSRVFAQSDHRVIPAPVDDVTTLMLRFVGGATGYLATHQATAEIWRLQAYGSKGWIEMRSETELVVADISGERTSINLERIDKERAELECFADLVAGGEYPVSDEQVLNSISVIEAVVASLESDGPISIGRAV